MTKKIPKFKKHIKNFLSQEDGKILKQSAISVGAFLLGSALASKDVEGGFTHSNDLGTPSYSGATGAISVTHDHHATHSSHGSHSSHSSHGSHGSHGSHSSHGSHGTHGSHGSHGSW